MIVAFLFLFLGFLTVVADTAEMKKTHLFILSGQSNMASLDPDVYFTPHLKKEFERDEVIVVHEALGAQPIRRWYKKWLSAAGKESEVPADIYDRLLAKVRGAMTGKRADTITFVWYHGARDAREKQGAVYAASLKGLLAQLQADLERRDINLVIGRLTDYDDKKMYPDWSLVREALVEVAESYPRGAWIDTDDLNGPTNEVHFSAEGLRLLGARLAAKAIELIRRYGDR